MNPSSAGIKILAAVCVLGLAVVGGGAWLYSRAMAPSPLVIPPPAPLPSPNGFTLYVTAARAIVAAHPAVDAVNDVQRLTPQQAAAQYSPQRRAAWIASNAKAWSPAAQARAMPCRVPAMRGNLGMFPAWAQLRELARCQTIRVKDDGARGQWNGALGVGLDTLQMGRDVERGANLIGSLVGMAIEAIADRSLENVPPHLDAASAKAGAKRLEGIIGKAQPFSQVIAEEKWNSLTLFRNLGTGQGVAGVVNALLLPRARVMEDTASMMDGIMSQAGKPMKTQSVPPPPGGLPGMNAQILYPVMMKSLGNDARRCNMERLLMLRLALRAYRLEHGSYPAQLGALAPATIGRLPIDPYGSGEGYHYRTSGDSYTVWSIGPDGVDNSGALIPLKRGQKHIAVMPDSKGDVVARP